MQINYLKATTNSPLFGLRFPSPEAHNMSIINKAMAEHYQRYDYSVTPMTGDDCSLIIRSRQPRPIAKGNPLDQFTIHFPQFSNEYFELSELALILLILTRAGHSLSMKTYYKRLINHFDKHIGKGTDEKINLRFGSSEIAIAPYRAAFFGQPALATIYPLNLSDRLSEARFGHFVNAHLFRIAALAERWLTVMGKCPPKPLDII